MVKKQRDLDNSIMTTRFDYQVLPAASRSIVEQRTGEIRERLQRSAQDIWEIGQRLADVRAALKHGQFDIWLKAEFGWSRRTAYNFINVYETFQERANLAQIDIATSALYLLAAPSTSAELREQSLQEAKSGRKVTYKELRDKIGQQRSNQSDVEEVEEAVRRPEIVTLIPQGSSTAQLATGLGRIDGAMSGTIDVAADPVADSAPSRSARLPAPLQPAPLQPGWYLLDRQHLVFYGDTASPDFYDLIPEAAFALAATAEDWDHDWLVLAAKTVTILPETSLKPGMVEQLIMLFSQPQDTVVFPWLPEPELIAVAHRLGRKVVAGDMSPDRCQQAIQATGLRAVRLEGSRQLD